MYSKLSNNPYTSLSSNYIFYTKSINKFNKLTILNSLKKKNSLLSSLYNPFNDFTEKFQNKVSPHTYKNIVPFLPLLTSTSINTKHKSKYNLQSNLIIYTKSLNNICNYALKTSITCYNNNSMINSSINRKLIRFKLYIMNTKINYQKHPFDKNKLLKNTLFFNKVKALTPPLNKVFLTNAVSFVNKRSLPIYSNFFKLKNELKSELLTRTKLNLTISNTGFFLFSNLNNFLSFKKKKSTNSHLLKRDLFTFIRPNQIKSLLLRRKSSIVLFRLISNHTQSTSSLGFSFFKNIKNLTIHNLFKLKTLLSNLLNTNNLNYPHLTFISNTTYNNYPKQLPSYEVRISRVRFKPGYQRIWRDARTALKDLVGLNFLYQKQLTKYLIKFYKKSHFSFFSQNEFSFDKLVLYSKVVPDYSTFILFFNSKLFFLNGLHVFNKNTLCVVNDFIQLVVSKWYYVFYRWSLNWSILRNQKLKRLIYRKSLSNRYKVMKSRKQRSLNVPDWIFSTKYDFSDVKPFIEVDYFTLSFMIIYEPYITYYYTPQDILSPRLNIYRLYNWKYIT